MTRYSKTDVKKAVSVLAEELGIPLMLEAWSPGDRYGTRYRVYTQGDTEYTQGSRLHAECGAKTTCEQLWTAIRLIQLYKRSTPNLKKITDLLDIEA